MEYTTYYQSKLGNILLACDEFGLTGLWFVDIDNFSKSTYQKPNQFLEKAILWLDEYFAGKVPKDTPPLHLIGTPFQIEVWNILLTIPYGKTTTYGNIAGELAKKRDIKKFSAQAVGGAVSKNPISIIVPCHRVVGSNKTLTGYAGGIERKRILLTLENSEAKDYKV